MTTKPRQNKTQNKNTKSNKKRDWSFYAIIVCLVILAIPSAYFGVQAVSAMLDSNKPILGDRFKGQFDNKISKAQMKEVEESIGALENVTSVSSTLITGTLRIAVVTDSEISKDSLNAVSATAYAKVVEILPVADYFKDTETVQRYDLEIDVHNGLYDDEELFMLQTATLNADMDDVIYQFLTTPQSQEWVDEMWERQKIKDEEAANKNKPKEKEEESEKETTPED